MLLDGREIEPVSGNARGETYMHYVNGHVLETEGKRSYTCYTYIDSVEMEEQMIVDDGKITAILINTFAYSGIQTSAPEHASWQSNLLHMRDLLAASVERWIVQNDAWYPCCVWRCVSVFASHSDAHSRINCYPPLRSDV